MSVTTNTAIDLARDKEVDIKDMSTKREGAYMMLESYYIASCVGAGATDSYRELPGDLFNGKFHNVADAILGPVAFILDDFCDIYDPSSDHLKRAIRKRSRRTRSFFSSICWSFLAIVAELSTRRLDVRLQKAH